MFPAIACIMFISVIYITYYRTRMKNLSIAFEQYRNSTNMKIVYNNIRLVDVDSSLFAIFSNSFQLDDNENVCKISITVS